MSNWNKLIKDLYDMSREFRFDELCKILEHYGYKMRNPGHGGVMLLPKREVYAYYDTEA